MYIIYDLKALSKKKIKGKTLSDPFQFLSQLGTILDAGEFYQGELLTFIQLRACSVPMERLKPVIDELILVLRLSAGFLFYNFNAGCKNLYIYMHFQNNAISVKNLSNKESL